MNGCQESQMSEDVPDVSPIISTEPRRQREIPLSQGKIALVDEEDYERLSRHRWYAYKSDNTYYARRNTRIGKKKQTGIQMHRDVLGLKPNDKKIADHRDFNGLNNCKSNLRVVSHSLNAYRRPILCNNTSGFIGVCFKKKKRLWEARITIKGKQVRCGSSKDILVAVRKRDRMAKKYYGEDAILNLPE